MSRGRIKVVHLNDYLRDIRPGAVLLWRGARGRAEDGRIVAADKRRGRRVRPYTTSEAALELGVSQRTVIRWCDAGLIDFFWTPGHGQRRIPVVSLAKYRSRDA